MNRNELYDLMSECRSALKIETEDVVKHVKDQLQKSKINFIRNERKRTEDKCSTKMTARKHQNMFDDALRLNGYPEGIIDQTKHFQNL